jgi:CheY-like chemotaxis protein
MKGAGETQRTAFPAQPTLPAAAHLAVTTSQIVREKRVEGYENSLTCVSSFYVGAESERVDTNARRAAEAAQQERERRASGSPMPGRLLLAVSDPARLAQVNSLIRAAGYEVRVAFDGQQAIDLLRIECPDLFLLDYELRDMNGVETLRRLRQQSGGKFKLPVALMLKAEHENVRGEALATGAQAVVTLPYDPAELLQCVRTIGNAN